MRLKVFLLGRFEVRRDEQPVFPWPRAAVPRVLQRLALAPRHRLPLAVLAQALWPQDYGDRVRQRLHHLVYLLRSALDPKGEMPTLLRTHDGVLQLATDAVWVDVPAFEHAAAQALQHGGDAAAALALYGGPLLPDDVDDPEFHALRRRLEQRHGELLHTQAELLVQQGRPAAAMQAWQQLLQRQPADERAHRALIRLYGQAQRRAEIERQYAACRAALADEHGVAPSAETHQAYREAMLAGGSEAGMIGVLGAPVVLAAAMDAARLRPPAPLVPLVDRDALVQQLADRLCDASTRLLTLVGPGGIGKTQLALRLAHELQHRYRHGAAFVSLAEVPAEAGRDGVADRLRRTLRLAEPAGTDTLQVLADGLRERHLLLVCDNGEHVTEGLGLLTELLGHCPLLTVLATSRRRLNLRAEQLVEVPALAPTADSGVRLFAQRAAAAAPGFALDDTNRDDVQAIVQQLGGLPLAIELVAARVQLLPPAALRRELAQGPAVVAGGGPDRPPRHRSMQASLAWSRGLLSPLEREVLDRAAIFAAPFEPQALAAVCRDLGGDLAAAAQTLGDLGLLARAPAPAGGAVRWQRAGVEAQAAAPDVPAAAVRAYVAWYAERATQLAARLSQPGPEAASAMAAFDAEHENAFAALEHARREGEAARLCQAVQGLAAYWARSGAWQRADRWVLQAHADAGALAPAERAALLLAVGGYWHDCQHYDRTRDTALEALAIARTLGDARLQAQAAIRLASAQYHLGESASAIEHLLPLCEPGHPQAVRTDAALHRAALNNLGNAHLCNGDLAQAHHAWQHCDAHFHGQTVAARVPYLHNLALVACYEGRHDAAGALWDEAEACERAAAPRPQRLVLLRLRRCWMACCRGDIPEAARLLASAREEVARAHLGAWQPVCAAHDGKLALLAGQAERAQALLQRALAQSLEREPDRGDPWDTLDAELWLVAAGLALAARDHAPPAVGQALSRLVRRHGQSWRLEHARILEAAAAWLVRAGQAAAAGRAWRQAQALRRAQRLPRFAVERGPAQRTQAALQRALGPGWQREALPPPDDAPLAWLLPLVG